MSKKAVTKNTFILILVGIVLAAMVAVAVIAANSAYNKRRAAEKFEQPDFYAMQQYSETNSAAVMDALKTGNSAKLTKLMIDPTGIEDVMSFTDWSGLDTENVTSMGAGSLTPAPDEQGRMDISERFIVTAGEVKYVIFVETLTSRWGMNNDGVSAVGVTTFAHFDGTDYSWNGEADDQSALAGSLFWNKDEEKE